MMTSTINRPPRGKSGPNQGERLLALLLTASLAAGVAQRVQAQQAPLPRVWAAQTGWNQVTLSWEEIPGAVEYRIYAGDPDAAATPAARRPISTLSGSGRYGIITGINRVTGGLYLEAVGRDRRRIRKLAFNTVTPVRTAQVVTPPTEVTATVTSDTVVTVSWTPVPGATAYMLGRAVRPDGLQMLCALCSTTPTYVDAEARPGAEHSYTVAAILPSGLSERTASNIVIPGTPVTAAGGVGTASTPGPTAPTSTAQTTPTTPYTPPGQPAGTATSYTPPGQPAGTTTSYTPPATSTPTTQTTTTTPATATGSTTQATTTTPTPTVSTNLFGALQQQADSLRAWLAANGIRTGGLIASDTTLFSRVLQQLDSLRLQAIGATGGLLRIATPTDSTFLRQGLGAFLQQLDTIRSTVLNTLGNMLTGQTATTTTHAATPAWTGPCRVDYQRADNMWAPFGKPVGSLGTESISLLDGQVKLFFTDWKYEKQRNDGSNYYGSHLRIATNPGARPVKLQTHTPLMTAWVTLNAGETKQFSVDLVQVSCTN